MVRTDLKQWVEEANAQADDYHKIRAYKIAAERLGVAIRIAEPVDCAASRSLCRGMSGIYIRRSDYTKYKRSKMRGEMWKAYSEIKRGKI